MSKFKGTQGKWKFSNEAGLAIAREYDGQLVHYTEYEANALLISKSPEMLEMLERVCNWGCPGNTSLHRDIKKIIQEATKL